MKKILIIVISCLASMLGLCQCINENNKVKCDSLSETVVAMNAQPEDLQFCRVVDFDDEKAAEIMRSLSLEGFVVPLSKKTTCDRSFDSLCAAGVTDGNHYGLAWDFYSENDSIRLFLLDKQAYATPLDGSYVSRAAVYEDPNGGYDLRLVFNERGTRLWKNYTEECVGESIAIMLQGKVLSAPRVMMVIRNGFATFATPLSAEECCAIAAIF